MSYITARSGFEGKSCDSGVRADCQNSLIPFSLTRVCPYQLLRGISLKPSDQGPSTHQIHGLWMPRLMNLQRRLTLMICSLFLILLSYWFLLYPCLSILLCFSFFSFLFLNSSFSYHCPNVNAHPSSTLRPLLNLFKILSENSPQFPAILFIQ